VTPETVLPFLQYVKWILILEVTEVDKAMRSPTTRAQAFTWMSLGLSALMAWSTCAQAQDVLSPGGRAGPVRDHGTHHVLNFFHSRTPPIPRTYSYYYNTRFNQPRHSKVVAPDGTKRWRTTVRGLPLGTPWPS
jgi:hypothetical protein